MTTERMTDERAELLRKRLGEKVVRVPYVHRIDAVWAADAIVGDWLRARRFEHVQAEKIRQLEDMLRIAHDNLAEQVRQARWEVAHEALGEFNDLRTNKRVQACLEQIERENAPKD